MDFERTPEVLVESLSNPAVKSSHGVDFHLFKPLEVRLSSCFSEKMAINQTISI